MIDPMGEKHPNPNDWLSFHGPGEIRPPRRVRCWLYPPPPGWVQLNISGRGSDESKPAGFGGIINNEKDEPLAVYCGPLGKADVDEANLEAPRQGLQCLRSLSPPVQCVLVLVQGNNLSVMRWVNHVSEPPRRMKDGFSEVFVLLKGITSLRHHAYLEGNLDAIALTIKGSRDHDLRIWIAKP